MGLGGGGPGGSSELATTEPGRELYQRGEGDTSPHNWSQGTEGCCHPPFKEEKLRHSVSRARGHGRRARGSPLFVLQSPGGCRDGKPLKSSQPPPLLCRGWEQGVTPHMGLDLKLPMACGHIALSRGWGGWGGGADDGSSCYWVSPGASVVTAVSVVTGRGFP